MNKWYQTILLNNFKCIYIYFLLTAIAALLEQNVQRCIVGTEYAMLQYSMVSTNLSAF